MKNLLCSWFRFARPHADAAIRRHVDSLRPRGTSGCVCGVVALALILPVGACFSYPKIPAVGYLANKPISTTVDSQLAKYYLEASSTHIFPNANANERIADVERRFSGRALDWLTLREISEETSPDFATTFFINHSLSDRYNQRFQAGFSNELRRIESLIRQRKWARIVRTGLQRYKLLFIPGFHYLSDHTSGADFSHQRQLMHQLGLEVQLAATEEDGTVEENAKIIARMVRAESRSHTQLILVSTSKGGPETALALGKILAPGETTSVKAWLSVGGLIRGTLLADRIMTWPKSWIARIIFSHEKIDFRSVPGLTTTASRLRMNGIRLPCHILVVQYVGAPLSGDISDDVRGRYTYLRKYGPNDGLTLLADELVPHGITIIEPGVDHFYRDPEINLKSLAIANLVAEELTVGRQGASEAPVSESSGQRLLRSRRTSLSCRMQNVPVSPIIEPIIRTSYVLACPTLLGVMKRDRLAHPEDLEKVRRGVVVVFLVLFSLPVLVSFLILAAALLTAAHRATAIVFPLNWHWAILLSIGFRISLIPGVVFLAYCLVNRLRDRPLEYRLALVVFPLLCLVVFICSPSRQYLGNGADPVRLTRGKEVVHAIPRSSEIVRVERVPLAKPRSDRSATKKVDAEL